MPTLAFLPCGLGSYSRQCRAQHSPPGTSGACRRKLHPERVALRWRGRHQSHSGNMAATRSLVHVFSSTAHSKLRASGFLPGTAMRVSTA